MHSVAERYLRRRTGHQEAQFQMVDSAGASNVCSHWIQAAEVTELRGKHKVGETSAYFNVAT